MLLNIGLVYTHTSLTGGSWTGVVIESPVCFLFLLRLQTYTVYTVQYTCTSTLPHNR
jgi:hypothetical protein